MKVTLILCTRNGGERLATCLAHIENLKYGGPLEFIIVDNASDDGVSLAIAERYAAESRWDCRVLRTARPGNAAGRNVAIRQAAGELLVFLDDDCYAAEDMVEKWAAVFSGDTIGYASGMVTNYDDRYPHFGVRTGTYDTWIKPHRTIPRGLIQGSNMAFRAECIRDIGDFDERLGSGTPYAAEDWDLACRASNAGWSGRYAPGPRVAHDHRRTAEIIGERTLYYEYGAGIIYGKHLLTRLGPRMLYRFVGELWQMRDEMPRVKKISQGLLGYFTDFPKATK